MYVCISIHITHISVYDGEYSLKHEVKLSLKTLDDIFCIDKNCSYKNYFKTCNMIRYMQRIV